MTIRERLETIKAAEGRNAARAGRESAMKKHVYRVWGGNEEGRLSAAGDGRGSGQPAGSQGRGTGGGVKDIAHQKG